MMPDNAEDRGDAAPTAPSEGGSSGVAAEEAEGGAGAAAFGLIACRACGQSFFGTLAPGGRCPLCNGWPAGEPAAQVEAPPEEAVATAVEGPDRWEVVLCSLSGETIPRKVRAVAMIEADDVVFRFSVRRGGLFRRRFEEVEKRVLLKEISDVAVRGKRVTFERCAESGGYGMTILRAGSPAEAAGIAQRLPKTRTGPTGAVELLVKAYEEVTPHAYVTGILATVNVAVFVIMVFAGVDWIGREPEGMLAWGACYEPAIAVGQWWRLLTAEFLHWDVSHLGFNVLVLVLAGRVVERLYGNGFFALIYLMGALSASLASIWWNKPVASAGASGAVFAIYGALLAYLCTQPGSVPKASLKRIAVSALAFIAYNIVFGLLTKHVDNAGHIGGLVGGLLMGLVLARPVEPAARRKQTAPRLTAGLAICAGVVLPLGLIGPWRPEPPACTSPEVVQLLSNMARSSLLGRLSIRSIGGHREVSYDREAGVRIGQCTVRALLGNATATYAVEWEDPTRARFKVSILPAELPPCTDARVVQVVSDVIRKLAVGPSVRSIYAHREVSCDRRAGVRKGLCLVRTDQVDLVAEYWVTWQDERTGRFQVRVEIK